MSDDALNPNGVDNLTGHTNLEAGARVMAAERTLEVLAERHGVTEKRVASILLTALRRHNADDGNALLRSYFGALDSALPACRRIAEEVVEEHND